MKKILTFYIILSFFSEANAQVTRLAILDFDNISGIAKYDGLGKAMSSMLISDIEANVSPKRLQLVERAQIQKVLKEQNFQASGSVNKNTAVEAGKLLGVNYLLIGDVYILNDELIINARLTNTETGDIVFSKKQEGKTIGWLTLKTNIAKDLASSLTQPFTEPTIPDKEMSMATITTFGNAITAKDSGNVQKAEILIETVTDFNPDFKYVDELRNEIENLKKELEQIKEDVNEAIENPYFIGLQKMVNNDFKSAIRYFTLAEKKIYVKDDFLGNKKLFINTQIGISYYEQKDYQSAKKHFLIALNIYPWLYECNIFYIMTLLKLGEKEKALNYYLDLQNKVKYFLADKKDIANSKINFDQGIVDGFGYLTDFEGIGSRCEFAAQLSIYLREDSLSLGVDILEIEYNNYLNQFKSQKVSKQIVVNYNQKQIYRYFKLINNYAWNLMIDKKDFVTAQNILIENLSLMYNLNTPNDYYGNDYKEKYQINFGDAAFSHPYESLGYILGNLLNCYAATNDLEKAKVIYCNLMQEGIVYNRYETLYNKLVVKNLLPNGYFKTINQDELISEIMEQDFKELNIPLSKMETIKKCVCSGVQKDWPQLIGIQDK